MTLTTLDRRQLVVAFLISAAPACARSWSQDALDVFRQIAQLAEEDARAATGERGGKGPLLVDVGSFALLATEAMSASVTERKMGRAFGRDAQAVSYAAAIKCGPPHSACEVVDDGVLIRLDSLRRTPTRLVAVVTSVTTIRRPSGRSAICDRQLLLTFDARGARWTLADRRVVLMC